MKLEDQVVSLELAKKMKELGFEQESLFYWQLEESDYASEKKQIVPKEYLNKIFTPYSAYTVAELGEMLPYDVFSGKIKTTETTDPNSKELIYFECWNNGVGGGVFGEDTEANVKAKMLIYLKENNLL